MSKAGEQSEEISGGKCAAKKQKHTKAKSRRAAQHGDKTVDRRSLCTPEVQITFCEALEKSHTIKNACVSAGISESSFYQWLARGMDGEHRYREFAELVRYARARGLVALVESIITDGDWRAKAWYLERTRPQDFGLVAHRVIASEVGQMFAAPEIHVTEERVDESAS